MAARSISRFRRGVLACTLILASSSLAAWATQRPAHAAAPRFTMTIVMAEEPDTLDPHKSDAAISDQILRYVGDPLIYLAPNGHYVPGLATHWTISNDGLLYRFDLRHGVTFQDGTPLGAAAFVQTFQRALAPATKSPLAGSLLGSVDSITTTGPYSFAIRLKHPYAFFLYNLTDGGRLMALSPTALRKEGKAFGRHPVSTGPWMVQSWKTGSAITLVKNPRYTWGPSFVRHGPPAINTLVFRLITDEATQTDAFPSVHIR